MWAAQRAGRGSSSGIKGSDDPQGAPEKKGLPHRPFRAGSGISPFSGRITASPPMTKTRCRLASTSTNSPLRRCPCCEGFIDPAGDLSKLGDRRRILDPRFAIIGDFRWRAGWTLAAKTLHAQAKRPLFLEPLDRDVVLGKRHVRQVADQAPDGNGISGFIRRIFIFMNRASRFHTDRVRPHARELFCRSGVSVVGRTA